MKPRYRSLPEFLRSPWCLLWAGLLPQSLLILLNLRAWLLVRGEIDVAQGEQFAILGLYQIGLLILLAAVLIVCLRSKRLLGWVACIPLFLVHLGYLWLVTAYIGKLLPPEVTRWMLPSHVFLFRQFSLMMPATFYLAARMACFPMTNHPLKDVGITVGTVILVPATWYTSIQILSRVSRLDLPEIGLIICFVVSTLLTIMAFLRLLMMAYKWSRTLQRRQWILIALAGLIAPIGGLTLNRWIPFPVDLQYPVVYILTILNAAVLLIPCPKSSTGIHRIWLARCALFPFTLYFFLLFLPFLPIALPAIFAAGAGFLILAPTLLFAIHIQLLIDEGKHVVAARGRIRTVISAWVAMAALPALLCTDALLDRRNLAAAIDAVYTPDTRTQPRISAQRAARAIERLDADKRGIYLPIISGAYRKLVFSGMVLPDTKMTQMYQIFTGQPLESAKSRDNRNDLFDFWTGWQGTNSGRGVPPPPRTATLRSTEVTRVVSNGMVTATLELTIANTNRPNAEFITRLDLSPGILVSGYWLDVEGEQKQGQLYEKRAAMWVYHMIRDVTRRDPGLLIFESPTRLKLNVYPFAPNQTRTTGIDFLFPAGMPASVTVNNRILDLAPPQTPPATAPIALESSRSRARVLSQPPGAPASSPAITRKPLIHILVDRSIAASAVSLSQWQEALRRLRPALPPDARYLVYAVNHRTHELTPEPVDVDMLPGEFEMLETIKPAGGLAYHQAIRRGVTAWRELPAEAQRDTVPMFVLLQAPGSTPVTVGSLDGLQRVTPDVTGYWIVKGETLTHHSYDAADATPAQTIPTPAPVLFPIDGSPTCHLPGEPTTILVQDPAVPLAGRAVASESATRYVTGIELWSRWQATLINPGLLDPQYAQLVEESRAAGIMLPVTSFMVVENSAQEEMLRRKHEQAKNATSALAFDEHQESPGPGIWLLLIPVLLLVNRTSNRERID